MISVIPNDIEALILPGDRGDAPGEVDRKLLLHVVARRDGGERCRGHSSREVLGIRLGDVSALAADQGDRRGDGRQILPAGLSEHGGDGILLRGILRAAVTDLREGTIAEGGSTLTQQYI